jgi:phage gp29-like protein
MYYQVGADLRDYEPGKIIQYMPRCFGDYPEREGYGARIMYWQFFKRFSWRHRMILTELFALPWRVLETDNKGETLPDAEWLDDAAEDAENMGADTTIALPPGTTLSLKELPAEYAELFSMNHQECNDEIAKLVQLQPTTTSGEMNRASGVIADKQQDIVLEHDGTKLSPVITEFLRAFVAANFGDDDAAIYTPTFILRTKPERDRKAEVERMEKFISFGLPIAEAEAYDRAGYRRPKDGEPVLRRDPRAAVSSTGGLDANSPSALGQEDKSGEGGSPLDVVQHVLDTFDTDAKNQPNDGEAAAQVAAARAARLKSVGLTLTRELAIALTALGPEEADRYLAEMVGSRLLSMAGDDPGQPERLAGIDRRSRRRHRGGDHGRVGRDVRSRRRACAGGLRASDLLARSAMSRWRSTTSR